MRIPLAFVALSALVATGCSSSPDNDLHVVSRRVFLTTSYVGAPAKDSNSQIKLSVRIHTIYSGEDASSMSDISLPTVITKDGGGGTVSVITRKNADGSVIAPDAIPAHLTDFGVSMDFAAKRTGDGKIHIDISKLWMRNNAAEPAFEIAWKGDVIPDKESSVYSTQNIR